MPDLVAKIGADSTQFRSDVTSLPGVVKKSFGEMKTASEGGISDNVKSLKRSFNDLKDLFVGAGIFTAVKKFYDLAIEGAKASTNANDENAQAVLRFADGLKSLGSITATVAKEIVGTFNQIGEMIGSAGRDAWDYWIHGITVSNELMRESERGVREQDEALSKLKKNASEWASLNAQQKGLVEARVEAERKALPIAEQRAVLEQKLLETQRAYAQTDDHTLEQKKAQLEILKVEAKLTEVATQERAANSKRLAEETAQMEKQHMTVLAGLESTERQKILKQEIADLEQLIASGVLSAADADTQRNILAGRQNELLKTVNEEHAKTEDFNKRSALSEEQMIERIRLQAKAATGLSDTDAARLQVLERQSQELTIQAQIQDLLAKQVQGKITPAEQQTLVFLIQQDEEIKKQIKSQEDLITTVKAREAAEKNVLTVAKEYAQTIERAASVSHGGGDAGYMKAIGGLRTYNNAADQSSYEQTLVRQAMADIDDQIAALQNQIQMGQRSGSSTARYEVNSLNSQLRTLQNRKANVQDYVFNPNYSDALGDGIFASQVATIGDPLKLQNRQTSTLDQINNNLTDLNTRFRKAGFIV